MQIPFSYLRGHSILITRQFYCIIMKAVNLISAEGKKRYKFKCMQTGQVLRHVDGIMRPLLT